MDKNEGKMEVPSVILSHYDLNLQYLMIVENMCGWHWQYL